LQRFWFMRPYSVDLRERIVHALEHEGQTQPQVAARFGVSLSSVQRFARLHREGATLAAKPLPGRKPAIAKEQEPEFEAILQHASHWTLQSLAQTWRERSGVAVSLSALHQTARRLGYRFKKRVGAPPSAAPKSGPPSRKKSRR